MACNPVFTDHNRFLRFIADGHDCCFDFSAEVNDVTQHSHTVEKWYVQYFEINEFQFNRESR